MVGMERRGQMEGGRWRERGGLSNRRARVERDDDDDDDNVDR